MNDVYRKFLVKCVLFLENINGNLFTQILNLACNNEYPNLREEFDDGEDFCFNMKIFEDSNDVNLLKLVKLYKKIQKYKIYIITSNRITAEELEFYFVESEFKDVKGDINDYFKGHLN